MGYSVPSLSLTKNYVLANGVSLLLTYTINFVCQIIVMACYQTNSKEQSQALQRLLEVSRTLYWFGVATAFSIFPPFYFGIHCVVLSWVTLLLVVLLHIFCFVRRCDGERSIWAYCYYFYHASIFTWIVLGLCIGYYQSNLQPLATDTNQM